MLKMRAFVPRFPCKTSFSLHAGDWRPANVGPGGPVILHATNFHPNRWLKGPGLTLTTSAWNERKVLPSWEVAMIGLDDPWKVQGRFRFLEWKILKTDTECWLPNVFPLLELEGMKTNHSQPKSKIDIQISKPWSSVNCKNKSQGFKLQSHPPGFLSISCAFWGLTSSVFTLSPGIGKGTQSLIGPANLQEV